MKINWKVRFKNPVFIWQLLLAVILPGLAYFGLEGKDMTSWGVLFSTLGKAFSNPYVVFLILSSLWNAVNDPTTHGATDSLTALDYTKPRKDDK